MTDKDKIKEEIERIIEEETPISKGSDYYHGAKESMDKLLQFINSLPEETSVKGITWEDVNTLDTLINQVRWEFPNGIGEKSFGLAVLEKFQDYQDGIEEPVSEDLEEEIDRCYKSRNDLMMTRRQFGELIHHFAEWQKQKDEELFSKDSWTYIEENYPNITEEEKLRLYDVSIKSRLAGAETFKEKMKEVLQTEYKKGRFDMREEMIKALVDGEVVKKLNNQLCVKSEPIKDTFGDLKFGDKVKIIIVKED